MKAFLLTKDKHEEVGIEDALHTYYDLLDCTCIDIVERKVGDKWFDIVVDDEGLLVGKPVMAVEEDGTPMLVGNLLFCHHDEEGSLTGLEEGDAELLERHLGIAVGVNNEIVRVMVASYE